MAVNIRVELVLDCEDLSCLLFRDTTADYNASTNPDGYGGINFPAISDITSVDFIITDSDEVEWTFTDAPYLPNAAGTSTICLNGDDFEFDGDTLEFAPGATYTLTYRLNVGSGTALEVSDEFVFPCCGDAVASNLGTDFSIEELTGCTSIKFTDTTGTYNASTNPGGYGTPNPAYTDITETLIRFTFNDGRVVDITDFIPTSSVPYVTINNQTLGFGTDEIPSQVVTIAYYVYKAGKCRIGYATSQVLLRCQLENCIAAQAAILLGNSYCDQKQIDSVMAQIWKYNQLVIASQGQISCVVGEAEKLYKKCSQGQPPCN